MKIFISIFAPPNETMGSYTRALSVGDQAIKQGHQVIFCASKKICKKLDNQGYALYEIPESTILGLPKFISKKIACKMGKRSFPLPKKSLGNIWMLLLITGAAKRKYLEKLVAYELKIIERENPDVIFTELDPAAYLVSEIADIPIATTYASITHKGIGTFFYNIIQKNLNYILHCYKRNKRRADELCFGENVLKIIPSIPELETIGKNNGNIFYCGYLLPENKNKNISTYKLNKNYKYVFVYLGTGSIGINKAIKVFTQLFSEKSKYKCIFASGTFHEQFKIENIEFYPYIPAEQVLPFCSCVICHGGHNTIIQSLMHGVPLIIFPGPVFERRFNAEMVEKSDTGFMGEIDDFNTEWLSQKLEETEKLKENVEIYSEKIKSYGGPEKAVEYIENFIKRE